MTEFRLWLPGYPVTTNHLFASAVVSGKIRRFPTKAYKTWRQEAVYRLRSAAKTRGKFPSGEVELRLTLTPPDRRKRDASNAIKPLEDALVEAGVLGDDSQIKRLVVEMGRSAPASGILIRITEYAEAERGELAAA